MRQDTIRIEEARLSGIEGIGAYPWIKERHRVFPAIFEDRHHTRVLDIAAGVGCAAQRIKGSYPAEVICNEICPTCLAMLEELGLTTVRFDIDNEREPFPYPDGHFDAIVALVTIEHVVSVDHFMTEIYRILSPGGYLYIATPNYAALEYALPFLFSGRTFHDPADERQRYEFYAHVRYFTYRTLLDFVTSFGFALDTVYIALPAGSSRYKSLYARSRLLALSYRYIRWFTSRLLPPRWAPEPILCFGKSDVSPGRKARKIVL